MFWLRTWEGRVGLISVRRKDSAYALANSGLDSALVVDMDFSKHSVSTVGYEHTRLDNRHSGQRVARGLCNQLFWGEVSQFLGPVLWRALTPGVEETGLAGEGLPR